MISAPGGERRWRGRRARAQEVEATWLYINGTAGCCAPSIIGNPERDLNRSLHRTRHIRQPCKKNKLSEWPRELPMSNELDFNTAIFCTPIAMEWMVWIMFSGPGWNHYWAQQGPLFPIYTRVCARGEGHNLAWTYRRAYSLSFSL